MNSIYVSEIFNTYIFAAIFYDACKKTILSLLDTAPAKYSANIWNLEQEWTNM